MCERNTTLKKSRLPCIRKTNADIPSSTILVKSSGHNVSFDRFL